jgi:hypothetical protein
MYLRFALLAVVVSQFSTAWCASPEELQVLALAKLSKTDELEALLLGGVEPDAAIDEKSKSTALNLGWLNDHTHLFVPAISI